MISFLQNEPLCSKCNSFVKSLELAKEEFLVFEKSFNRRYLKEEFRYLLLDIYRVLAEVSIPDNPVKQKKEGNCNFSKGICLAKSVIEFFKKYAKRKKLNNMRRGVEIWKKNMTLRHTKVVLQRNYQQEKKLKS